MPNNLLNSSGVTRLSHDAKQYANSRIRELTYAEYDALSQAEKMNGTWYFVREEIVNKPVMTINDVSYTGSAVSPTFTGFDSTKMSITGNTATEIGTYVAKISPLRGYCWPDITQIQETYTWTISQATSILTVPEQNGTLTYDTTQQSPTWDSHYDSTKMTVTGDTGTNAGEYTATFSLIDKTNTQWSDGTTTDKTATWSIEPKAITFTGLSNKDKTYNGSSQAPTIPTYDSSEVTVSGDTSGINAGDYTVSFTLKSTTNYKWDDDTTAEKTDSWAIAKATFTATVSVDGYAYAGTKSTPSVSANPGGGTVTYYASATAGGTATEWSQVTATTYDAGTRYCYALINATENYEGCITAPTAYTISKGTLSATVSISGYTYAGTKSTPTISGNTGGGTVTYYGRSTSTGTGTAWTSVSSTTYDAGTRYCYATIAETTNFQAYTTPNTSFTIAKANFTATVSISGYTYAGTKSTPTLSNNPGNASVTYYGRSTSTGSGTVWSNVTSTTYNAGTRYCYAVIAESTNYNSYTTVNTSFTIAKASFTATVSISGYTYGGTKSTPTVSNNPGSGTVTYYGRSTSTGTATNWSNVTSTTYDAGTRYCYAVIAETTNYNSYTTTNKSFTISKAAGAFTLSKSSVSLNSTTTSDTVTATVTGNGVISAVSNNTSVSTVSVSGNKITITGVATGSTTITVSLSGTTNYSAPSNKTISVAANMVPPTVFGVEWTNNTQSPVMTRTDDSANFADPVPAINGGTGSSPFDNIMPWSGMQIVEDSNAGTLVQIPKFWYKQTITNGKLSLKIANEAKTGYKVAPAFQNRGDGSGERNYVYVGRYYCSSTNYKSVTGQTVKDNITRATARTAISNLGSNIWQFDFALLQTIRMLYLVEFANWDIQSTIGAGVRSSIRTTGGTDSMQYHTGTMASIRNGSGAIQYRYIEDIGANIFSFVDGIWLNYEDVYVITNPLQFADSPDYSTSPTTYPGTKIGTLPFSYASSGVISEVQLPTNTDYDWIQFPSQVVTSAVDYKKYTCSGIAYSRGTNVYAIGGSSGDMYDMMFWNVGNQSTYSGNAFGCRLMKL